LRNPGLKDAVVIKKSLTAVRTVSFKGLFVTLHFLTVLSVFFLFAMEEHGTYPAARKCCHFCRSNKRDKS